MYKIYKNSTLSSQSKAPRSESETGGLTLAHLKASSLKRKSLLLRHSNTASIVPLLTRSLLAPTITLGLFLFINFIHNVRRSTHTMPLKEQVL